MKQSTPQGLRAEFEFLADLSAPLVYVLSRGGGDQTEATKHDASDSGANFRGTALDADWGSMLNAD